MESKNLKQWTDDTLYSQNEERIPRQWGYATGKLSVSLLNRHRHFPGKWVVICHEIRLESAVLKLDINAPIAHAQAMALRLVTDRLQKMIDSI